MGVPAGIVTGWSTGSLRGTAAVCPIPELVCPTLVPPELLVEAGEGL
jgi:hypothetical protein